tara:strand:- start:385 stop:1422 length:1038 start_codon:yes stop_codon:yes gene_type:complete
MSTYNLTEDMLPSKVLYLDSKFATTRLSKNSQGDLISTDYIYNLKEPLICPDNMKILISLYNATIPFSFYNLREQINDRFYLSYSTNSGVSYTSLYAQFNTGNYNAFDLIDEFKRIFGGGLSKKTSDDSLDTELSKTKITFTLSYDRKRLKYNFGWNIVVDGGSTITDIRIDSNEDSRPIRGMFGLVDVVGGVPMPKLVLATTEKYESPNAVDLNDNIHGLYIRQNISSKGTLDNESGTFSNILARIPITTNAGGIIFHKPNEATHQNLVGLHAIDSVGCKLTDDSNRAIDLNGLDWQCSFLIQFVRNIPLLKEVSRNELRILRLLEQENTRKLNKQNQDKKIKN